MNYNDLPDIIDTDDIMSFLDRSRVTVTRLLKPYQRLCVSTKPYRITRTNLISVLERSVPTDAEIRRRTR